MRRLMIWVIDDQSIYRKMALETLTQVAGQISCKLEIKFGEDWTWPPKLKRYNAGNDEQTDPTPLSSLPDLVVLDLFLGSEVFCGKDFYECLRNEEKLVEKPAGAFILVWSNYWSDAASLNFVTEKRAQDDRLVAPETKALTLLAEAIKGCIGRIEEES